MGLKERIPLSSSQIANFCQKHHIKKLSFFGSILRNDFGKDSDIDILIEFEAEYIPGLEFFSMEEELSCLSGRKVDLQTPKFLSPEIFHHVLLESEVVYEQT